MRRYFLYFLAICLMFPVAALAHEAWILTPEEVSQLSKKPTPELFRDPRLFMAVACVAFVLLRVVLYLEDGLEYLEICLFGPIMDGSQHAIGLVSRVALSLSIGLGAVGALPRHGTKLFDSPTLFVPDMQLELLQGWQWLGPLAVALSVLLLIGLGTRLVAVAILGLTGLAAWLFGREFMFSYAPHFIGLTLMVIWAGGGNFSCDRKIHAGWLAEHGSLLETILPKLWSFVLIITGATFVYLALRYKLLYPNLLIAILEHGEFPLLGLPVEVVALVMMIIELVAGILLMFGRLVRPIGLFLIGAFTIFAVCLNESPFMHSNLYGLMVLLVILGNGNTTANLNSFQFRDLRAY